MKYRNALPQLAGKKMITDGGLETTLVFLEGIDLPLFAAFKALETDAGLKAMDTYMKGFAKLAVAQGRGFIMDTPTWRASARWAAELGMTQDDLREVHREAIATLDNLRRAYETPECPFVINGIMGPQDDGYSPGTKLTADQAADYHKQQPAWFAEFGADMITAMTLTYSDEAIGITRAAKDAGMPVVISFTVETDGRLPSGESLAEAIAAVDRATKDYPAYYMINCAHPEHFSHILNGDWTQRIMGLRTNASRLSHAELDEAETLDDGNPEELGLLHAGLADLLPNLTVLGGCCGTDHRHVEQMCRATQIA
ncbi:homocysteine S-methyltransferase family protein [Aliiroseovarius sp. S2029]|uniref:homocysteine S-methyltransferase family protein n=1 Tax=Aliiroseovarius sp. S2029 TaxID=2936988 RepID=UPI0020BE86F6|nr:homocysteine S-methyltransferase family protein [Aliiroseovarius sp. S2029]MCK8483943.1 homocysteine S-methyltransferase family protein [Aliiroseovarius sp. S2029]